MKILDHKIISQLNISMDEYYKWAKDVLLEKDNTILPPKISMKKENHIFFNVMPSIIDSINAAGVKVVSRFHNRIPSLDSQIILYGSHTGENLALLDGNIITAYRTGAVAALSINLLAKPGYETIAIMGLGNIARATFNILLNTIEKRKIKVKVLKYKGQEVDFINYYQNYDFIEFEVVDNYRDLFINSDVIISCVTSTDINFGENEYFKEGCLVVPVHTMGFQNCDLFFDKFIVDDIGHVSEFKYFSYFKEVHELAEVLKDSTLGRKNNSERIIAYNVGNSNFDIYFAKKKYDKVKDKNLPEIDLKGPKEKYWV